MPTTNDWQLTPWQHVHSGWNRSSFTLRCWLMGLANPIASTFLEQPGDQPSWLNQQPLPFKTEVQRLLAAYPLADVWQCASLQRMQEVLCYLSHLETLWGNAPLPAKLKVLDVGAKSWPYVDALWAYFTQAQGTELTLHGIELDGGRRLAQGYTRAQLAQAYTQPLPNAHYFVGNACTHTPPVGGYEVITVFLPFLNPAPCLAWGLPAQYAQAEILFEALFKHLAATNSTVLVVNQGEAEARQMSALWERWQTQWPWLNLQVKGPLLLPKTLSPFKYARYGWQAQITKKAGAL
jgi:hypothetical protein